MMNVIDLSIYEERIKNYFFIRIPTYDRFLLNFKTLWVLKGTIGHNRLAFRSRVQEQLIGHIEIIAVDEGSGRSWRNPPTCEGSLRFNSN